MKIKKPSNKNSSYKRLFACMKPYKAKLIIAIIVILLSTIAYALAPLLMGNATDALAKLLVGGEQNGEFIKFLIMMGCAYGLNALLSYIGTSLIVSVAESTIFDLRKRVDYKLSKLPLNYYDTNSYGDILSRVTNDVDTVSNSLQQSIYQILNTIFTIVIIFAIMLNISGVLTLVGLAVVPFALYAASKIAKKSQQKFNAQQGGTGKLNGLVEEYYSGHNVVTVFGREETVIDNFELTNEELYNSSKEGQFLAGTLTPIMQNMTNLGYALVSIIGALMAIFAGLSVGMIQSFTLYLRQFSQPLTQVMQIANTIQATGSAASRIFEFLDEKEEVPDVENPQFPEVLKGEVDFDHIRFGYLPHQTLITDLDITIGAGEKTAIVGPTGAGKTTLVNLIMRFYDVRKGGIKIDGVDIRDMERSRLREIFGMVLQDTWLYNGTIRENIRYGKLDATDEEVEEAAKKARADAFIRTLPGGYDFVLHEGASNIAQGQRQLLTIARAMLNNPPIMILDEATSSVDTRTEVMIQEAMNEMMKGKTSFIIAHRLSTIKDAENILYMQDGDILEVGNHEELMAKDGLYAKLYNSQFSDNQ
ncbi:MAG: ABC transporter ATP-binding protein [Ruminococcus sp.]|nr:ABC transporter ATP-binding protein [Ruminococcus sp.]MBQ2972711.1 ABC transporter ATP-binding protein [Ruminococcus sp.]